MDIYGANDYLKVLYDRIHGFLLKEPTIHTDETVMRVLDEGVIEFCNELFKLEKD